MQSWKLDIQSLNWKDVAQCDLFNSIRFISISNLEHIIDRMVTPQVHTSHQQLKVAFFKTFTPSISVKLNERSVFFEFLIKSFRISRALQQIISRNTLMNDKKSNSPMAMYSVKTFSNHRLVLENSNTSNIPARETSAEVLSTPKRTYMTMLEDKETTHGALSFRFERRRVPDNYKAGELHRNRFWKKCMTLTTREGTTSWGKTVTKTTW